MNPLGTQLTCEKFTVTDTRMAAPTGTVERFAVVLNTPLPVVVSDSIKIVAADELTPVLVKKLLIWVVTEATVDPETEACRAP